MSKKLEKNRSCCDSCIHYFVCSQCDDNTLVCSQYKNEQDYRKTADVAIEVIMNVVEILNEAYIKCNKWEVEVVMSITTKVAELKKKYESEGVE